MKFWIYRTSKGSYSDEQPCPGAVKVTEHPDFPAFCHNYWVLEIPDTITALFDLMNKVDSDLVIGKPLVGVYPELPRIEIYDDYRE